MVDLKTTYLNLELKNPLVASASPLSDKVETVQALEAAGISAVVMYSCMINPRTIRQRGVNSVCSVIDWDIVFSELALLRGECQNRMNCYHIISCR